MTKKFELGGELVTWLSSHNGGTAVACTGTAIAVTVPTGSQSAYIKAQGGAAYYNLGTVAAGTTSYGYVPQDQSDMIFSCDNLTDLSVFGAAAVVVHIQFYTG
jgi:hypothetical protein